MVNLPGNKIEILKVRIDSLTVDRLHERIENIIKSEHRAIIAYVNIHALNLAYQQIWLRRFLNQSDVNLCDGAGVILAGRLLGHRIPERITYADWMWQLAQYATERGFTFFFLGSKPGVAQKAGEKLSQRYPALKLVGCHHGYFDKTMHCQENEKVVRLINDAHPDILTVGFGMPLQERWLMENWERLDARIALTGGAVFDYLSGELPRAPRWMTDHGLEWLGRLMIEPKRLWKRYLIGNPLFFWRIFKQKMGWDR